MFIDQQGLVKAARQCPSPNQDERPDNCPPDLLIIHNISLPPNEFGGPWIDHLFLNQLDPEQHPYFREIHQLRVSAHLLIRRDGELVQYVPLTARAWHAGQSCFEGREACNNFSIGIELEGADHIPFTNPQYQQLVTVTKAIMARFPGITPERITGHSDVAPGRKTDPGPAFDWLRYRQLLAES
ncbi:MAG: 1,6-anhydro-N-acetylmuramyl-L-alanine amidase AmpD [Chromatiales bacterium]|nr:1,6-anhydro-N-acetylmuramyl-L-alanine amidase AmpD [Chromatiales bacterium]